jgi:putative peptide zinc metalloprotease protein
MEQQSKRVALPAYLRRRLLAFNVGMGAEQSFIIKDPATDRIFPFEPWQFFILEILPGCENFPKLESIFEDRFGRTITKSEVEELFSTVAGNGLFGIEAASHPMLSPYAEKKMAGLAANTQEKPAQGAVPASGNSGAPETTRSRQEVSAGSEADAEDIDPLPAGVRDVIGLDETKRRMTWKLFDPRPLLKILQPLLSPFRHAVYLLPLLLISALFTAIRHEELIRLDMTRLLGETTFFEHALFSMFTVNLLVTLATAMVAYTYRATVSAVCVVLMMGFLPRFMARVGHTRQLSRHEKLWLHATPILLRAGLFSAGILIWFSSRAMESLLAQFGLALAVICTVSLLFTANPLVKSSGYFLLAAFLDEPNLFGKSYKAFFNRLRGNVYSKSDSGVLAAFALASFIYIFLVVVVVLSVMYSWLHVKLGGASIILIVLLGIYLFRRLIVKFQKIEQAYDRTVQFERWRKRTLSEEEKAGVEVKEKPNNLSSYVKRALPFTLLIILFLPYSYEPGGSFIIFSGTRQELTTDIAGTIAEVYFDGGEELKKGTVIARLSSDDYQSQVEVYSARMQEQQSVIDELKAQPRPEEVKLAESALQVALTQEAFSQGKAERSKKLYQDGAISFEEMDRAEREDKVDISQVEEKRSNLALIKSGAPPDAIAAAEGKWKSFKEERDAYQDKINRSIIRMPFDGVLVAMQLKQKVGGFLEKGTQFAIVEQTDKAVAEIEVPESDIGYVTNSAQVVVRPTAYYNKDFTGTVTKIDKDVTSLEYGKVVKVSTVLDNKDGKLKAGMTGYAKIDGGTLPVWEVFSLTILRFIQVEIWSWIP